MHGVETSLRHVGDLSLVALLADWALLVLCALNKLAERFFELSFRKIEYISYRTIEEIINKGISRETRNRSLLKKPL